MSIQQKQLTKAKIIRLKKDLSVEEEIPVLFNPEQYSVSKSNQFAAIAIPGRPNPIIQFIKGEAETLTLDLFFDTHTDYGNKDVQEMYTDKISDLQKIVEELHAPPVCLFKWGKYQFTGVIEKIDRKFTMFDKEGKPLRATMNISFKQYTTHAPKVQSSDFTKRRIVSQGDPLWLISSREYNDPDKWKLIAESNDIEDPLAIKPGTQIILPKL